MNRRTMLTVALAGTLVPATRAFADGGMSRISAYAFSFPALSGDDIRLAAFTGKPLLVVNTASLCGYTPQYAGLQEIWNEFRARGLAVIGVPSNDFGGQEPGGTSEIAETAHHQYGVTFPITAKAVVVGANAQMGRRGATERSSALELPQIPDRPRRLYRRRVSIGGRTGRHTHQDGHCQGAGRQLTQARPIRLGTIVAGCQTAVAMAMAHHLG